MEKKKYSTPLVDAVLFTTPDVMKIGAEGSPGSDLPPGMGLAPARRFGEGKAEVF